MNNKITDFLKSGLGLLITGFILTTVCGGIINSCHSSATWKRDKNFELFKGQVAKHDALLTDLSKAMGDRVFRLARVFWNLDPPSLEPPGEMWHLDKRAKDEIENETRWNDYYKTVVDWNLSYRDYKRRIQLLAKDKKLATEFFEPDEHGAQTAKEGSILALFEGLHRKVRGLHEEARKSGTVNGAKYTEARDEIQRLYNRIDDYMADLSKDFEKQDGNLLELGPSKD